MMIENLASVNIGVMTVMMKYKVVFKDVLYSLPSITSLIFDFLYTVEYAVQSKVAYIDRNGKTNIHYYTLCFFSDDSDDKKERKPCIRKDCGIPQIRYYGELRAE
jgi:hypothetical protein